MERVPEPELMLDAEQARAYAAADFAEPHDLFVRLLGEKLSLAAAGRALDLGCGPGDVTFRFARRFPAWTVDAIDASPAMLALGRAAASEAGLAARVHFVERHLPADDLPQSSYDLVFSNSLLHHLAYPSVLWTTIHTRARPGAGVFVMDLIRPRSRDDARALVDRHAGSEAEVLRTDFFNSLLAAYRPAEVRDQLAEAGLDGVRIEPVSDRHFIAWGIM